MTSNNKIDVSIIVPVYNGDLWLEESLNSVVDQDFTGSLELSVFNDASTDKSMDILTSWSSKIMQRGIKYTLVNSLNSHPKGVGYAKNKAVEQSTGEYLCFLDCDDVMNKSRIKKQYEACSSREDRDDVIIGCQFHREPPDSTPRYVHWANNLEYKQLYIQIYTSFGPTVVMPTWFCHRSVFNKVKGFSEKGKGTPEDLLFFYDHLRLGGKLLKVEEDLLLYRYHLAATTFSVTEEILWEIRLRELERNVLTKWTKFTIWNAGKQGRKFFRSLSQINRLKVQAFCDVDVKKLAKGIYIYEESEFTPKPKIPIVHFTKADPPFILCIKIDMTGGSFEKNLSSLTLTEGVDYFHFS